MRKIDKEVAPEFFSDFITRNNPTDWSDIAPIRSRLREYILGKEQNGYCAYTTIKITDIAHCHIDHFYKRDLFPNRIFDYHNMLVSCNSENYGAKYKDKKVRSKEENKDLINPVSDNPAEYIEYTFTGEIVPINQNQRAKKTIEYFNLNSRSLVKRRKSVIYSFINMAKDFSEEELVEAIGEFEPMLRQLYNQI